MKIVQSLDGITCLKPANCEEVAFITDYVASEGLGVDVYIPRTGELTILFIFKTSHNEYSPDKHYKHCIEEYRALSTYHKNKNNEKSRT